MDIREILTRVSEQLKMYNSSNTNSLHTILKKDNINIKKSQLKYIINKLENKESVDFAIKMTLDVVFDANTSLDPQLEDVKDETVDFVGTLEITKLSTGLDVYLNMEGESILYGDLYIEGIVGENEIYTQLEKYSHSEELDVISIL